MLNILFNHYLNKDKNISYKIIVPITTVNFYYIELDKDSIQIICDKSVTNSHHNFYFIKRNPEYNVSSFISDPYLLVKAIQIIKKYKLPYIIKQYDE